MKMIFLLNQEMASMNNFQVIQYFLKQIIDLKEYMSYEVNKLKNNTSYELIKQLREENNFLKNQVNDQKILIKDILENNSRQTQSIETVCKKVNEWKYISRGPSGVQIDKPSITCENRFNVLSHESHENHESNNGKFKEKLSTNHIVNKTTNTSKGTVFKSSPLKNTRWPNPVINPYPDRERYTKDNSNNSLKIRIISDSIPKGIHVKEFNRYIHAGNARFKSFPGASISNLNHYISPTLVEEKPDIVIIHVGINNKLNENLNANDHDVVDGILEIGNKCVRNGVKKVLISSIVKCRRVDESRIININTMLKEKCQNYDFIYLDNDNIEDIHLWKDGLHLNDQGKIILARNFIDYINDFLDKNFYYLNRP